MRKITSMLMELAYYDLSSGKEDEVYARSNDEFVLHLSREIINSFKRGDKKYSKEVYWDRGDDYAEFDVKVRFIKRPKQEYSHSIEGGGSSEYLELIVEYNPKMFPAEMNRLVAEIKETITHELEHVGQQNFADMFVVRGVDYGSPDDYFTSREEIPAFVKGLIKRAKVTKQSLDATMEQWHQDNIKHFELHNISWPAVKKVWMDWAKANVSRLKKI